MTISNWTRVGMLLAGVVALVPSCSEELDEGDTNQTGGAIEDPGEQGFEYGVAAGDVDSHSAILWAKAKQSGEVLLQITRGNTFPDCNFDLPHCGQKITARGINDNTVQRRVGGLRPGTRYEYRFCTRNGELSETGQFTTAPDSSTRRVIRFAVAGDQDARPSPGQQQPHWDTLEIWDRIRARGNDFNVLLGDTIYSDTEIPGYENADFAATVEQKRTLYKLALEHGAWARARGSAAYYGGWDDHEFINDFAPGHDSFEAAGPVGPDLDPVPLPPIVMDGAELFRRGARAFREYNPVTHDETTGLYRSVRWGKNLEIFLLDERSFRSNSASYQGNCDNPPGSGAPDLAPMLPSSIRDEFAALASQFALPVPAQCLEAIDDPQRTLLGAAQLEQLKREIADSTATFKVILGHSPIHAYYTDPYDRWEGYAAERQELLQHLHDHVENVVFMTHSSSMVNDARFTTLEPGGPQNSGILDITVGSVAAATFGDEIATVLGTPSGGVIVHDALFKPQPPAGVGMQCAAIDQPAYAQVEVSDDQLTIDLLDANDQPVRDTGDSSAPGAPPCGRITIIKQP